MKTESWVCVWVGLPLLVVSVLLLVSCCHADNVTGTGSFPCETCELRTVPVDLVCTKNAESLAESDATSKAKKLCTSPNTLSAGTFSLAGPARCVKRGNQWYVDVTVTGAFKCCN